MSNLPWHVGTLDERMGAHGLIRSGKYPDDVYAVHGMEYTRLVYASPWKVKHVHDLSLSDFNAWIEDVWAEGDIVYISVIISDGDA